MKTLLEWLEENRNKLEDGVYEVTGLGNICHDDRLVNDDGCMLTTDKYEVRNGVITLLTSDPVNSPLHYMSGDIECIDAIKASMTREAFLGYLKGNIQKYMWRYEKKVNPIEDVKKARWYMNKLVDELDK